MAKKKKKIKLNANISRRDFIGGTLVGVGAVLLYSYKDVINTVSKDPHGVINDSWTGYGGIGDYAISNGNVASTRDAAHLIRDGFTNKMRADAEETDEEYDMVIIGGDFLVLELPTNFIKNMVTLKNVSFWKTIRFLVVKQNKMNLK